MSKPATEIRLQRAAEGFNQVIGWGNAHIITKNPSTGKCAYDGQVGGGWHYGAGLETDTAWLPGITPWNWQMVKALYNVFALSNFSSGQIIKWVDPASGQYVAFQPMALQWTNSLNQIQQISMPQSVAAQANDDILYWPAAYGSGRNFKYQACPDRLSKQLIIDAPSALPSTSYDTLELNFIISASGGVDILVDIGDGQGPKARDKKSQKDTTKAIAFQLPGGAVLWSFAIPRAWDSARNETIGSMRLKKSGSNLYVSVRFPKAWIDSISKDNYPIILDPTIDYGTGSYGADDGYWYDTTFNSSGSTLYFGSTSDAATNCFARWTGVTIPAGATIDVSYISFYFAQKWGTPPICTLRFEDAASPNAVSGYADGNGKTLTTASIEIAGPSSGTWWNSNSINTIIQELVDSYSYASGASMQAIITGADSGGTAWYRQYTYNSVDPLRPAPKLHIEYTEAAGGDPEGSLIGGKLIRGGLLLHGVLGR